PGSVPPGRVPPGSMPPGTVPPGRVPPGSVPPGKVPPGRVPPGNDPPDGVLSSPERGLNSSYVIGGLVSGLGSWASAATANLQGKKARTVRHAKALGTQHLFLLQ